MSPSALVVAAGLAVSNAELAMVVQRGAPFGCVHDGVPLGAAGEQYGEDGARVWLAASRCDAWAASPPHCNASRLLVRLPCGADTETVLWGEAANRLQPSREIQIATWSGWAFHPADLNRDGARTGADLVLFLAGPWDWNGDGVVDGLDVQQLMIAHARPCLQAAGGGS